MSKPRIVVVGAGHAGGTFVALLRREGFQGSITLIGAEKNPPYHRPPLSKSFDNDNVKWIYDPSFYLVNGITTLLGETAESIDKERREVHLANGTKVDYDLLVIATGAEPRRLNLVGEELKGITTLRDLDDARRLREGVMSGKSLGIVGGGYIGLEVAAAARERGVEVTVLERENRILARVASPTLSTHLTELHKGRGTKIVTEAETVAYQCDLGRVGGICLSDGSVVHCEMVLVGAGAVPRDALARQAGLACGDGILVDSQTRTSDPFILAIGDVSNALLNGVDVPDGRMRVESIPSAVEQARRAVEVVLEKEPNNGEVPWFWSDQFDLKIKIAGIIHGEYQTVLRGNPSEENFALYHVRDNQLIAAETVNSPKDFMAAKRLIASKTTIDPQALSDPGIDLRTLVDA